MKLFVYHACAALSIALAPPGGAAAAQAGEQQEAGFPAPSPPAFFPFQQHAGPETTETADADEEAPDAPANDDPEPAGPDDLVGPFMRRAPVAPAAGDTNRMVGLKYDDWDVNEVLKDYSDWTGLALMKAPGLPSPKITLKCPVRLPINEALLAIESILAMHGIALVPMGDKFLKVVPIATARQEGMKISVGDIREEARETDHLVSQVVTLSHIDIKEARDTIQNLLHPYGKILALDRVNSMLITDTALNITRILEILQHIDQPIESREELRIFRIVFAKASDIRAKIQEILADTEERVDDRTMFIRRQLEAARRIARTRDQRDPTPLPTRTEVEPSEERGLIHAKVRMVADDRTGSLIVITRPEQFPFIESMIAELDQQVEPDVTIKVFRLQYASANDVVDVLNSIITPGDRTRPVARPERTLRDERQGEPAAEERVEVLGRISDDVRIIADPRINALLVMASRADMAVIEDVMTQLDIMLSQVLIEVVIVEIGLTESFQSGVDWLQRSMIAYTAGDSRRRAFMGFSGVSRMGTDTRISDGSGVRTIEDSPAAPGSGLSYYFTFFDYNLDVVLNVLAQHSEARILSTPVILTTDNTEARIMVGEKRPIVTSTSITAGGVQQSTYQYTDIGIELKVTPNINKDGFVVMDIQQSVDNVFGYEIIDDNKVPIIVTREFSAALSVDDGHTIVVGGLMSADKEGSGSKVPLLGDIPLVGRLFRWDRDAHIRRELLVMITPYVLDTPGKVRAETRRRYDAIDEASELLLETWSGSELLVPTLEGQEIDR